jgi:hypothetical protein
VSGGISCILALSLINPLGHWGHLPWGNFDILLNRKGFPIKVTVIGHPLLRQSCIHLPWALGKYRLCDNTYLSDNLCIYGRRWSLLHGRLLFLLHSFTILELCQHLILGLQHSRCISWMIAMRNSPWNNTRSCNSCFSSSKNCNLFSIQRFPPKSAGLCFQAPEAFPSSKLCPWLSF